MVYFVLIIWLTGPAPDGTIVEVGPVVVTSYTTKSSCTAMLNRMIKASNAKVRGRCDEWK